MNIGIDIIEIDRLIIDESRLKRILSPRELKEFKNKFQNLSNHWRKKEFLAGKWACKEAIIKSIGKPVPFHLLDIRWNQTKLICKYQKHTIYLSLSHNKTTCVAVAIEKPTIKCP